MWNASRFCVSSLRRGHANLLCIVPILVYVLPKQVQDELFGTLNHVSVSFDGRRFPRGFSPEGFFPEWNFPSGKHPANFLKIFFKVRAKSVEV